MTTYGGFAGVGSYLSINNAYWLNTHSCPAIGSGESFSTLSELSVPISWSDFDGINKTCTFNKSYVINSPSNTSINMPIPSDTVDLLSDVCE